MIALFSKPALLSAFSLRRMPQGVSSRDEAASGLSASNVVVSDIAASGSAARGLKTRLDAGLTLIELIITVTILGVLASAAVPVARFQVKREKERRLRQDLWQMRDAIDHYKDAADKGGIQTKADSFNYPPDMQTLVDGVDVQTKKVKFLRSIPVDPMTGTAEWDYRSMQDEADATSWGGQNVFDVHTKSSGTALDGTKYTTW
jgi:general secretion pathway protein G